MRERRAVKGQAALEFLSTYGFVFLIILVLVGAMSYFGLFSPSKLIPTSCTAPADIGCTETRALADTPAAAQARLTLILSNKLPTAIVFASGNASSNFGNTAAAKPCIFTPTSIEPGAKTTVDCNLTVGPNGAGSSIFPTKGSKAKIFVDVQYTPRGSVYPVLGRVQIVNTLS